MHIVDGDMLIHNPYPEIRKVRVLCGTSVVSQCCVVRVLLVSAVLYECC